MCRGQTNSQLDVLLFFFTNSPGGYLFCNSNQCKDKKSVILRLILVERNTLIGQCVISTTVLQALAERPGQTLLQSRHKGLAMNGFDLLVAMIDTN